MGLRFFADQCVPSAVVNTLNDVGYEVFRVKDYIPIESPDSVVISKAQELDTILISLNGDFADIVAYPPADIQRDYCTSSAEPPRDFATNGWRN